MTIAGQFEIRLADGKTRITSTRPLGLASSFAGRRPADLVALIPLAYSVCAMAQGVAATRASEGALRVAPAPTAEIGRELLVLAETAREHLLRIANDWRRLAGARPDAAAVKRVLMHDQRWRKALETQGGILALGASSEPDLREVAGLIPELSEIIADLALGEPPARWLARASRKDVEGWAEAFDTPASALMGKVIDSRAFDVGAVALDPLPDLDDAEVAALLLGPEGERMAAEPTWDGRPRETTPLSRNAGHPLLAGLAAPDGFGLGARLVARLVELATVPERMSQVMQSTPHPAPSFRPGIAAAQVEAARGRLIHAVAVDGETIARYRILAPTEWNFHPKGAAARALALIGRAGRADTGALADMLTTAFDPCVDCKLEVA